MASGAAGKRSKNGGTVRGGFVEVCHVGDKDMTGTSTVFWDMFFLPCSKIQAFPSS